MIRKIWKTLAFITLATLIWYWLRRPLEEEKTQTSPDEIIILPDIKKTSDLPTSHQEDDLTKITGIGPKISFALHDAGITSYKQLAEMNVERIQEILNQAGLGRYNPSSWPEQAGSLAKNS